MVAAPHSPDNTCAVDTLDNTPVQVAYIGACTGAKLDDLRAAAQVLRNRKVYPSVRLLVAPASVQDQNDGMSEGTLQVLIDAGAKRFATSCGACSGYGNEMGREHVRTPVTNAHI